MYRNIQLDTKLFTMLVYESVYETKYKPWTNDVCVIGKQNTFVYLHTTPYVTIQLEIGHRIN